MAVLELFSLREETIDSLKKEQLLEEQQLILLHFQRQLQQKIPRKITERKCVDVTIRTIEKRTTTSRENSASLSATIDNIINYRKSKGIKRPLTTTICQTSATKWPERTDAKARLPFQIPGPCPLILPERHTCISITALKGAEIGDDGNVTIRNCNIDLLPSTIVPIAAELSIEIFAASKVTSTFSLLTSTALSVPLDRVSLLRIDKTTTYTAIVKELCRTQRQPLMEFPNVSEMEQAKRMTVTFDELLTILMTMRFLDDDNNNKQRFIINNNNCRHHQPFNDSSCMENYDFCHHIKSKWPKTVFSAIKTIHDQSSSCAKCQNNVQACDRGARKRTHNVQWSPFPLKESQNYPTENIVKCALNKINFAYLNITKITFTTTIKRILLPSLASFLASTTRTTSLCTLSWIDSSVQTLFLSKMLTNRKRNVCCALPGVVMNYRFLAKMLLSILAIFSIMPLMNAGK